MRSGSKISKLKQFSIKCNAQFNTKKDKLNLPKLSEMQYQFELE